jgi:hypothetical protein
MRTNQLPASVAPVIALLAAACATLPPPPQNAAPPLTALERAGQPGIMYSDVIQLAGEPIAASAPVARGGSILTFPYRYRHTAVLTEDLRGYSITVSGVQAPAGSPGYYAGTFMALGIPNVRGPADLWCFLPSLAGGERRNICLLRTSPSVAAIAPTRMNPYLWTQFSPATGTFDYVNAPVFERREVEIPVDLTIEYRFEGWSRNVARVSERAVGREVRDLQLTLDPANVATIRTVAGDIAIAPVPGQPDVAAVTFTRR